MLQIAMHGRAGQGTQVATQLLAAAFHRAGAWTQVSIGCEGGCSGSIVTSVVRVDTAPIGLAHEPSLPDHLIVLDPTILAALGPRSVRGDGTILINAPSSPCRRALHATRVVAMDATAIAERVGLDSASASALLGAFAAATGLVPLAALLAAVAEDSPENPDAHAAACAEGYQEARALVDALPRRMAARG